MVSVAARRCACSISVLSFQVFERILDIMPGGEPSLKMFVAYFESGAWRAIRAVFGQNVNLHGFAFHFQQALWRNIVKNNLDVS